MRSILNLVRVRQWTKNLLCFVGVLITPHHNWTLEAFENAALVFIAFCFMSSAVYVLNDLRDVEHDRKHERKRHRPLASGAVGEIAALIIILALSAVALALAYAVSIRPFLCLVLYAVINLLYSSGLKHTPIVDVFCIAMGFVLRLLCGVYAIGDSPSAWMLLCTLFITLFIGFGKRRSEIVSQRPGEVTRPVLSGYTADYLDSLTNATGVMAILSYAIFTVSGERDQTLVLTVLPVVYGVFHFSRVLQLQGGVEEPDRMLFKDRQMVTCGLIWLVSFILISRMSPGLFK
jgi:4-hydroxybenzoate polyprenyltransferase